MEHVPHRENLAGKTREGETDEAEISVIIGEHVGDPKIDSERIGIMMQKLNNLRRGDAGNGDDDMADAGCYAKRREGEQKTREEGWRSGRNTLEEEEHQNSFSLTIRKRSSRSSRFSHSRRWEEEEASNSLLTRTRSPVGPSRGIKSASYRRTSVSRRQHGGPRARINERRPPCAHIF